MFAEPWEILFFSGPLARGYPRSEVMPHTQRGSGLGSEKEAWRMSGKEEVNCPTFILSFGGVSSLHTFAISRTPPLLTACSARSLPIPPVRLQRGQLHPSLYVRRRGHAESEQRANHKPGYRLGTGTDHWAAVHLRG